MMLTITTTRSITPFQYDSKNNEVLLVPSSEDENAPVYVVVREGPAYWVRAGVLYGGGELLARKLEPK